ncbi:MAG: RnfABCDGE type electron transport complex subunit B [Thermoanaerobaculales bacterium]|nr:RnfABCDGE type electron transport complex subunit B [Thermoanaerobaculales bacterium]
MLTPTAVLAGIGLVSGLGLAVAAKVFAVEIDPRQEEINDQLPGANCGGCGYAGCADFSAALVEGKADPGDCPVCDDATLRLLGEIMGVEVGESVRHVALIMCQGGLSVAHREGRYNGHASCASADLIAGGGKLCSYGCLGLADCQAVCAFGAIEMIEDCIARVIPSRCTACGKCVAACPKHLIRLVPANTQIHVLCSNTEKGAAARKACNVSCLGCKKCEKTFEDDPRIIIHDHLAKVDYLKPPTDQAVVEVCPTGALTVRLLDREDRARQPS